MGIELKLNTPINDKFSVADLKTQGYKSIYLAIGAQKSRSLPIPGADAPDVLLALDFLRDANEGKEVRLGRRVVVIGGGNVAMDVARTARRLGATDVQAVCLESAEEMPSHPWEVEDAKEEEVQIKNSWGPTEITLKDGKVSGVRFQKCTSVFDSEGNFSPTFDESAKTKIDCDTVIIAIGQTPNPLIQRTTEGLETTKWGTIIVNEETGAATKKGVYAGGDVVSGAATVISAMGAGKTAALGMHEYIQKKKSHKEAN